MKKKWKVIYYKNSDGTIPVKEFIDKRSIENKQKILSIIDYLQELGVNLPRPYADYLRDGIYELRVKLSGDQTRTLYFFCYETCIVLTHTFTKNSKKVPDAEIRKAIKYKEEFLKKYSKINIKDTL